MPTYHDLLVDLEKKGPYLGDPVGKCRRELLAFNGSGKSRIDKFLTESATYRAALQRRNLKAEFQPQRAQAGYLVWKERRNNGIVTRFPVAVDEVSGVVKSLVRDEYGLLEDVIGCLHRKSSDGTFVLWKIASPQSDWVEPTQGEIDNNDSSKSDIGTKVVGGARIGQIHWRTRVAELWSHACAVTGCREDCLLDGAHILPHCDATTEQRLDEQNGILLVTQLHRAFDRGLISFADDGTLLLSSRLSRGDAAALAIPRGARLKFVPERTRQYLAHHRSRYGFE